MLGNTWRDLAIYSLSLKQALNSCNADKKALRNFFTEEDDAKIK